MSRPRSANPKIGLMIHVPLSVRIQIETIADTAKSNMSQVALALLEEALAARLKYKTDKEPEEIVV